MKLSGTALALGALAALALGSADGAPPSPDRWVVDYDGHGRVVEDPAGALVLEPGRAVGCATTHAALARMRSSVDHPVRDFRLTFRAVTDAQLRRGARPNEWEALWLFFNYTGAPDDKRTNYLAFKTNGVEIGRAWGSSTQRFLSTGEGPGTPIGHEALIEVTKVGQRLTVTIDGALALRYDGVGDALFDEPGAIGFYTEDARVRVLWAELQPAR